ncbi:hypothetical protein BAUCODRAFT_333309 [Baudoinia panamericana UAMH 10762]|uniref:Uncharacterized protein n=1 Tax=Baudoinia panamericana (strain UAMH 10762) TaxID=717646 RepID=M2M3D5_BAUPA|nr:uncharacterized protein BAUCODRAFT_333309 [Baudoinia panamericana UAMH 10762]EMC91031.1 hypothetical protein BAUCODRAFT_333309 [Baudoinia panamericana UAMH 10762]
MSSTTIVSTRLRVHHADHEHMSEVDFTSSDMRVAGSTDTVLRSLLGLSRSSGIVRSNHLS